MASNALHETDLLELLGQLKDEWRLLREMVAHNCESGFMFNLEKLNTSHRKVGSELESLAARAQESVGHQKKIAEHLDRLTEQLAGLNYQLQRTAINIWGGLIAVTVAVLVTLLLK